MEFLCVISVADGGRRSPNGNENVGNNFCEVFRLLLGLLDGADGRDGPLADLRRRFGPEMKFDDLIPMNLARLALKFYLFLLEVEIGFQL